MSDDQKVYLIPIFEGIYLIVTFCVFALALVINKDDLDDGFEFKKDSETSVRYRRKNRIGSVVFNLLAFFYFCSLLYVLIVLIYVIIFKGFSSSVYIAIIVLVPCSIVISLLIYRPLEAWQYLKCAFPYVYYIPTYINILQIYAICKTDDISWGTRSSSYNSKTAKYRYNKFAYLMLYVICNSIFGFLFERFYENGADNVLGFLYGAALLLIITPLFGEFYYICVLTLNINSSKKVNSTPIPEHSFISKDQRLSKTFVN